MTVDHGPLGKTTAYSDQYDPALLHAIPRAPGRALIGVGVDLPFTGADRWNCYEVSWLDDTGRPRVAVMEVVVPAASDSIVESKSLKLYLGSFNNSRFVSPSAVAGRIREDLSALLKVDIEVLLYPLEAAASFAVARLDGVCIDDEPCGAPAGDVDAMGLSVNASDQVEETLYSHLLRSNCPVTGQPDWATVVIRYRGPRIDRMGLLAYIVSYRNHNEFHEQCVERMFMDIKRHCNTEALSVLARYTRRGGIDINPYRSDTWPLPDNLRTLRQ